MEALRIISSNVEGPENRFGQTQKLVEAIGRIHFRGNILPHSWFQHPLLHSESGRVNLVAAVILSDIVYWYRPREIRDESTGKVTELRRRFEADKLQKSYQAWANQFGLTKRQVKDAVQFLRNRGLLKTELRHFTTKGGMRLSNVMYVEPVLSAIEAITSLHSTHPE